MRPIKFRGKHYGTGVWVYGDLIRYDCAVGYVFIGTKNDGTIQVIPETVGQFTGLHDKNGREIYEGDIVRGVIDTQQRIQGRVYIESEHGSLWGCYIADGFEGKDFGSWDMRQLCWGVDEFTPHCEVIGNIYENPELVQP